MCGIVGVWDFKDTIQLDTLKNMCDTLAHRGPDDDGFSMHNAHMVGLAQRRLSIIDLSSAGHQPMVVREAAITFNGEIYNFDEIRKELIEKGYTFTGHSDTEVILKGFIEWKEKILDKLRGMFAFAIWDEEKKELFIARDRTGIKPLYYHFDGGLFVFASELKAIVAHPRVTRKLNQVALSLFLQTACVPSPHTIYENIYKLDPGHYLVLDRNGTITKSKYWDASDFYTQQLADTYTLRDENLVQDELEELLAESFKLRMVSDVEVGMFLSGGIDSSLVAALLTKKLGFKNLKTFTIGFEEGIYNEANHAKKIAHYLGTDHYEKYCTTEDALNIVPTLPDIYDEPFGDASAIPTTLLAQFAREHVKVSLSADGGDEVFCGYDRYIIIDNLYRKFNQYPQSLIRLALGAGNKLPVSFLSSLYTYSSRFSHRVSNPEKKIWKFKRKLDKLKLLLDHPHDITLFYQLLGYGFWKETELDQLIVGGNQTNSYDFFARIGGIGKLVNRDSMSHMQYMDYKTYLPDDIMVKVDRATMSVGLEGRDPLLDHKIYEFAARLPIGYKYKDGQTKYLLRKILYNYIPRELVDRPKQGFSVPLEKWLKGELRPWLEEYLSETRIKREGIFNYELIKKEKQLFLNGGMDFSDHLWLLLTFEMWKEKWLS